MPRRTAATKLSNELNRQERSLLKRSEHAIAKGLYHFIAVGAALAEIQEKRLYRQSHDTFEAYLAERWDMARATGAFKPRGWHASWRLQMETFRPRPERPTCARYSPNRAASARARGGERSRRQAVMAR